MKVLLTKDVQGLGRAGDVKEVSDGHARNFLLPKRLALPATTSVLATVQKEEKEKQEKFARQQERLMALKAKLEGKTVVLKGKAEGKNLFAGIRAKEIAEALAAKFGAEISPDLVLLDKPLKNVGAHQVEIKLSDNVKVKINLDIQPL